ncbi:uncharacterized protein LOC133549461 isoform X2 [Nerophis ophidion]|uniref:uncharacterized protein LOC133549461 isoform X2 n=1 Tax=Nerophis ophidion TaxID=159077 RepID=UPI002AE0B1C8|nr:uncharacterized protein LOC133549461 isoform X2 [Nerophis ophidion]
MKPAAAVLLLLLSPLDVFGLVLTQEDYIRPLAGEARTEEPEDADLPPELPLIWKELVGLRQLVLSLQTVMVDQRQALRTAESRLRDSQVEVEHQRQALDSLQVKVEADRKLLTELTRTLKGSQEWTADEVLKMRSKLNTSESSLEDLKKMSALAADVPFLRTRLRASERVVDELRRKTTAVMSRLCHVEDMGRQASGGPGDVSWETRKPPVSPTVHVLEGSNVTSLDVRLQLVENNLTVQIQTVSHLEDSVLRGERHLQEFRAAVGTSLNHTRAQSEGVKVRLSVLENLLEDLRRTKSVQSSQLSSMEVQLADSYNNTASQAQQLSNMEARLTHTLNKTHTVLQHKLNITDQKMNVLKTTTEELMLRVHVLEQHGQRSDDKGETKVAFAAALTDSGSVGPFDQETTLIFSKVFTNVGQAYDVTSGVFTAPVGGVYAFSFTAADFLKGYMGVTLYRNQQPIVFSLDLNDHGGYASVANGVLLGLEAGDHVRLSLPASYRLYDDARNFSVFSGFMLFAL